MMTNAEIRELIDADDAGKDIECRDGAGNWLQKGGSWNFNSCQYRVKPVEPIRTDLDIYTYEDEIMELRATGWSAPQGHKSVKYDVEFIEVTDEVRATLTEKGILKC